MLKNKYLYIVILIVLVSIDSFSKVKPASLFTNNLVLQRNKIINVWGKADVGEKVTVTFDNQSKHTVADANKYWKIELDPMSAGGPYEMKIKGENEILLKNILIGEVWVCSGQSNMGLAVKNAANGEEEIANANYPMIRLFDVKRMVSDTEQFYCSGSWAECSPKSVGGFSAAAYYFGRELYKELNVPIGLIESAYGGTEAECWMEKKILKSDNDFVSILNKWDKKMEKYPADLAKFNENSAALLKNWYVDSANAVAKGMAPPRKPGPPEAPGSRNTPCGLFNAMIVPLIPYTIQGVIWYQGEANVKNAFQYRRLFPALIQNWRDRWGQGEFPFYFVQLPNLYREPEPTKSGWPELRESQMLSLSVPNTGMAVTIDIGDPTNLHPKNKQDVGHRLALIAESKVYGKDINYSGPIYKNCMIEGKNLHLTFDQVGEGLLCKGSDKLIGFEVLSPDGKILPAEARIAGNDVVVWNDSIPNPVSARYAWGDDPKCNLYNNALLPASPFRTDSEKTISTNKQNTIKQ